MVYDLTPEAQNVYRKTYLRGINRLPQEHNHMNVYIKDKSI